MFSLVFLLFFFLLVLCCGQVWYFCEMPFRTLKQVAMFEVLAVVLNKLLDFKGDARKRPCRILVFRKNLSKQTCSVCTSVQVFFSFLTIKHKPES